MPKAIVAVKPASSASGASGVARYIAESKLNPEKEGLREGEARPLFSTPRHFITQINLRGLSSNMAPQFLTPFFPFLAIPTRDRQTAQMSASALNHTR